MKCKMCEQQTSELSVPYCSRCDKMIGDVNADIAAEFGVKETAV